MEEERYQENGLQEGENQEKENREKEKREKEDGERGLKYSYRAYVRRCCSRLGWSLAVLVISIGLMEFALYFLWGLLEGSSAPWAVLLSELFSSLWFSTGGMTLLTYCLVLPVVFRIMDGVPEVRAEPKKMRVRKLLMFFVLAQGMGYLLNLAGNMVNGAVADAMGRDAMNMNPVTGLFDGMDYLTLAYIAVAGPLIEEYIFRWKLLNRLRPMGEKAAILFSALMFGFLHGNITQMLYATAIGIVLGYMAVKTGRMRYNCILHIMINSYSVLLTLLLGCGGLVALVTVTLVSVVTVGMVAGAAVILFLFAGRVRLLPGDWPEGVKYGDFAWAMYWNSGVAAFVFLNLLMAVYYLLLA